ncbi:unnamed protein product [Camellia sinensis]
MCSNGSKTAKIGAIIDANSHIGKEQKIDMEIAAQNFEDPGRDPLQVYAVSIAPTSLLKQGLQPAVRGPKVCICWLGNSNLRPGKEQISRPQSSPTRPTTLWLPHIEELIKEEEVQVIVRMETWHEATLVASIGNREQVPILEAKQLGKLVNVVPKGWTMPSEAKKLKIGVLAETAFEMFVKVVEHSNGEKSYLGFCIEVFEKDVEVLGYDLPYKFEPFHLSYDDLVLCVGNKCDNFGFFSYVDQIGWKTYDAIVGDTTILADRFKLVRFTRPFLSSGLPMIVLVKTEEAKASTFIKPFTIEMWIVTALLMIYTMFVVWFLEHQSNPEFRGPWKTQLSTTMWFTFSSLFFSHREKIYSNYIRVVVVMWLFVVFVVTSSYTANLTSLPTVPRLEPTVTDIEFLRRTSAIVGCDGDSYVKHYLVNVLQFKEHNMKAVGSQYNYLGEFESGNITAAFLEPPYEEIFLRENCNKYTVSGPTYKFGGWGFARIQESQGKTTTPSIRSLWRKMFSFARYFHNGGLELQGVLQPLMAHGMCGALGSGSW